MASGRLKSITTSLSFLCTYRVFSFRSDFLPPREIDACFISSCFFPLFFLYGDFFASLPSILLRWKGKDYFNMEGRLPGIELSVFVIPTLDLLSIFFLEKTTG